MTWAPDAVLFDLDDTLVRPPGDAPDRLRRAFDAAAVDRFFDTDDVARWVPRVEGESPLDLRVKSFRAAARDVADEDAPDQPAAAAERVARAYDPPAPAAHDPVPGAPEVVRTLADRGFDLGLVTNGAESEQRPKLRRLGLTDAFDATFFATPDTGIKPNPTPFRTVVDRLGHAPRDCVSVGDGYETDIEPASELGMHTVWVPTDTPDRPAPAADTVCGDLRAVVDQSWATD